MSIPTMFQSPRFVEKVDYEQVNLDTARTLPGNGKHQTKTGMKFSVKDRDVFRDWYDAYFHVEYTFEALAAEANIANNAQTAPINSSFSLIKKPNCAVGG